MRYRKLDDNYDMTFGHGVLDFYQDSAEGVAQLVVTRLRLFSGEWYLDTSEGTPWQGGVLGYGTQAGADTVLRSRILDTDGVESLISYSSVFDADRRSYAVLAEIATIYGAATINVTEVR